MNRISKCVLFIFIVSIVSCSSTDPYDRFGGDHLHITSPNKELFWFSGVHNSNPRHKMFDDIEAEFFIFSPTCVLVEGGSNKPSATRTEAILRGGESSYVAYLAYSAGIPVYDIEPDWMSQIDFINKKLLERFNRFS